MRSALVYVTLFGSTLQCATVRCSVLQCAVADCSVFKCVAVCYSRYVSLIMRYALVYVTGLFLQKSPTV